ncbi:VOC family protein [Fulvivirga sp.]|uniref:VOC family protein n=1 Tax=Fulvivirga sp. TaxID=1931237 RepID=UPI0032EE7F42
MKKLLIIPILLIAGMLNAQTFDFELDHTAVVVTDLDKSVAFYKDILQLKEIKAPGDKEKIRWFTLGNFDQLHLIKADEMPDIKTRSVHFSLNTQNFDAFVASLESKGVIYTDWPGENFKQSKRPDGVRQVYIQDPDGNWIELNDAKYPSK